MKTSVIKMIVLMAFLSLLVSCNDVKKDDFKVWAWLAGRTTMSEEQLDHYFSEAARAGIDAIILECHGARPEVIGDSASFRDDAAILILEKAAVYAKKYNIELHAWMWTTNRAELSLRKAHPEWYQVNAQGESCADIRLYNREHYRFLCPTRPEVTEYLKERVREIATVEGLTGIHMDFIRYPDVILPYRLQESRGVVQDRVYPLWDFCYCDVCRAAFKEQTGVDPMDIGDPTSDQAWMQFRYDRMSEMASEIAKEIKACGKVASAAVFASPYESRKLVRQDWANFRNLDYIFPMIYHKFYFEEDEWVEIATREGVEALRAAGNDAVLCSGLFVGHVPVDRIEEFVGYTENGGSAGICFFSMEEMEKREGYVDSLRIVLEKIRLSD